MIRAGEPNDYAAEILFELPLASNPLVPKTAHVFVLGEVQIKLPSAAWVSVALDHIIERGEGWYAIRLTAGQRAAEAVVAYDATCAGAQPDRGTEIIGGLSGDISEGGEGIIPFYLPDEINPLYAPPLEGHIFLPGEVQLSLPDDAFGDVDPADIVELGGGMYGVQLDATQTTKRGKAIVVANVPGAQRFSGARTILGDGALVTPVPPPLPPSSPGTEDSTAVAGDILLTWSNATGDADISLITADASGDPADIATDRGFATAVLLSLCTDRRAEDDDVPPSGDPRDRRGWWADEFLEVQGDKYGSRWWLLDRAKNTNETALRRKEYAIEALAWMIEDRVVASIDVTVTRTREGQFTEIDLQRPGRDPVSFRFAHIWNEVEKAFVSSFVSAAPARRSVLIFGQSNATGWASSAGIVSATDYTSPYPQVSLAQKLGLAGPANPIVWTDYATGPLKPRPAESPDFGVELSLGHQLAAVGQFDIIKVAVNSSSLGSDWLPPGIDNLVTQAISFATAQAAALSSPPAAIVWIQGENDAGNAGFAAAYEGNLGLLLAAFRAIWPGIPFIIVKLSNSNVGANKAAVRAAEVAFAGATAGAYLVDADDLVNDGLHYNPGANIKLGKRIANVVCAALGLAAPADPNPPTIATNKGAYANAENIQVTWTNLADTLDWINVVEQGSAADRNFGMWCYTNGTQGAPGAVTPAGSKTFVGGLGVPGTYVVRLLSNDTFTLIAESAPFTVAT